MSVGGIAPRLSSDREAIARFHGETCQLGALQCLQCGLLAEIDALRETVAPECLPELIRGKRNE